MMKNTNDTVRTASFVNQLVLPHYRFGAQHDAQEALNYIIENCYPDYSESIFGVIIEESYVCERDRGGCGEKKENPESHQILPLRIHEMLEIQTVQQMLDSYVGYHIPYEYRCELNDRGCGKIETVSKASIVTEFKDMLIIHLEIFTHDIEGNKRKLFPAIEINENVSLFDSFCLQGIVWHHGIDVDHGHYTAMVKNNETWYHISDTDMISQNVRFSSYPNKIMVPYISFYNRNSSSVITEING